MFPVVGCTRRALKISLELIRNNVNDRRDFPRACRAIASTCQPVRMSSSLGAQFEQAKSKLNTLPEDPGNETKLKLYGLFKQATAGTCNTSKPGVLDFVGRAKWDAWNKLGTLSPEDAKQQYVDVVNELLQQQKPMSSSTAAATASTGVSQYDGFMVTKSNRIRTVAFNRPEKKNSITFQMYNHLRKILDEAADDDDTVAVVITGKGDYFSSGNDLNNFLRERGNRSVKEMSEEGAENVKKYIATFIDFPKPLIGAVNGPAVGVSVTVLSLFDVLYASDMASFHTPFSSLGLSPEGCSSYTFPKIMGTSRATEMLLFNRKITAQEAKDYGFVADVFPNATFQEEVQKRLDEISRLPRLSLMYSKELVRNTDRAALHQANAAECDRLVERFQSDEAVQAVMKFFTSKGKL